MPPKALQWPLPITIGAGEPALLARRGRRLVCLREGLPDSPVTSACLSITSHCNESCVICLEDRDPRHPSHMPFESARRLASVFAGRVPLINFSSSETLLHPRFLDISRIISRTGTRVGVVTNALALARPGFLQACVDAGLRQLLISCHASDQDTFGRITGVPGRFPDFVKALDIVDAFNRRASQARRLTVIVEIVLMRPLLGSEERMLDFLEHHLRPPPPLLRVETFRPINAARSRPDLQPDLAEVRALVARLSQSAAGRFPLSFRHVPLCLLPGREHLATEAPQTLGREKTLGNAHSGSLEIIEQARAQSAREQLVWSRVCSVCDLNLVCPGVYDIPVRNAGPHPPAVGLSEVAARLKPPINPSALPEAIAAAVSDRDGGPHARARFSPADAARLCELTALMRARGFAVEEDVRRVEIEFADPEQDSGRARVMITPMTQGQPCHRRIGSCSVVYCGKHTPRVREVVDAAALDFARSPQ